MFVKPFKVKSNNQLKGSERRKLCDEVSSGFPTLTDEEIQNLLPKKEAISFVKIVTHSGQLGKLYCVAKMPMFFRLDETSSVLFPTVYTLWRHPNLLYAFATVEPVVAKLAGGANLMLPGVILDGPANLRSFGRLAKGVPVSVCTDENKAPVAVGLTALSSEDMYMSGGHGKCMDVVHVAGDCLCRLVTPSVSRPNLGPARSEVPSDDVGGSREATEGNSGISTETLQRNIDKIDLTDLTDDGTDDASSNFLSQLTRENDETLNDTIHGGLEAESDPVREMDNLLEYCFLTACKVIKKSQLPMLSSNFFKNHLIVACPEGQSVDVKKSSYKKLSLFLASMKSKGVINTEILKGVESILSIQAEHPLLRELVVLENSSRRVEAAPPASNAPVVADCYKVTAQVVPLLSKFNYEKGDVMNRAEIRKCFTDYVKKENLQEAKIFKLDPLLAGILRTKENQITLTMEDGINKFVGRMTHLHEITFDGARILHTGKLEPIDITVTTRASNKKVTLINNLESFGIKLEAFGKECQGIGASATVTSVPGKKTSSVLVQGNQVLYVHKLLTEKYQINKNYIRGLEFAPKKRK